MEVEELNLPDPPDELMYLVRYFEELSGARQYSMAGPQPIGWNDIMAWRACMGVNPPPWEIRTIRELDNVFLRVMGEKK